MAGEDREFGLGMFPILIATVPPEEAPKLPREDIRMKGHRNVVSPTLIHLDTPVELAEEAGDLD